MDDRKLRVLIVDDTIVYRRIMGEIVESYGEAQVVGTAPHGRLALSKMQQTPVDLVLLDVEMPEMNGLETLREIRRNYPDVSVVMVSGTNMSSAEITLQALEQGALDFLRKPEGSDIEASRNELKDKLRPLLRHVQTRMNLQRGTSSGISSQAKQVVGPALSETLISQATPAEAKPPRPVRPGTLPSRIDIIAIGISTGGPNALADLIPKLPADLPVPILMVQHMPPVFTASLAEHLNHKSRLPVREARDGEAIEAGTVLIAPGGRHMVVRRYQEPGNEQSVPIIGLNDNPPENSCRPSVDVLFRSIAAHYEGNMLALVMTGMGNDGCEGVRAMKRRGCHCITQTESSCVVYGMPLAVDEAGLSDEQINLDQLAERITYLSRRNRVL